VAADIEIWPSATHFHEGDILRLLIQGTDVNKYPQPLIASLHENTRNRGDHIIHAGGRFDSHLLVPILRDEDRPA
jgi:hypothetical protein